MTSVSQKRFFVYALARLDGRVFYVGKGSGKRIGHHLYEARRGDCHCKKCKIIQEIERSGRELPVLRLYETNNEQEALSMEAHYIQEYSARYKLCNRNGAAKEPSMPKPPLQMSIDDMSEYLGRLELDTEEHDRRMKEWAQYKSDWLRREWRTLRLQRRFDQSDRVKEEIEALSLCLGNVYQHVMIFRDNYS